MLKMTPHLAQRVNNKIFKIQITHVLTKAHLIIFLQMILEPTFLVRIIEAIHFKLIEIPKNNSKMCS